MPICLYRSHRDPQNVKSGGKPCRAAASLTVILLKDEGTGYFVMSSPSRARRCICFSQSSASESRRRAVSMIGVLLPPETPATRRESNLSLDVPGADHDHSFPALRRPVELAVQYLELDHIAHLLVFGKQTSPHSGEPRQPGKCRHIFHHEEKRSGVGLGPVPGLCLALVAQHAEKYSTTPFRRPS